jgi:hypothetical protein
MTPLRLALVVSTLVLAAAQRYKLVIENMGDRKSAGVSIFWLGAPVHDHIATQRDKRGAIRPEEWLEILKPGEESGHTGKLNDRFILRGMPTKEHGGFRAAVKIEPGVKRVGAPQYPFSLVVQAIATEEGAGRLQLGFSGPENDEDWPDMSEFVDPGGITAHSTFGRQTFTIREEGRRELIKLILYPLNDEHQEL